MYVVAVYPVPPEAVQLATAPLDHVGVTVTAPDPPPPSAVQLTEGELPQPEPAIATLHELIAPVVTPRVSTGSVVHWLPLATELVPAGTAYGTVSEPVELDCPGPPRCRW